jgi:ABC-2 type transport system ATP-binding protein
MIKITNLTKKFKDHIAVNQLNLEIVQGEYVALLGVNGAGKTTLVEMIEGLQSPTAGTITIQDLNWKDHAQELRQILGLSLQETKFIDKLSVVETLQLFASFYRLTENRVQEVLDWINLRAKKDTYTVNLSGGQRQRLALGVALLHQPQLLLLDEPTTGLDPNSRRELWELLLHLKKQYNMTLLLTTHYMEEAEQLCERIVIMDNGKIIADGTLQQLLATHSQGETIDFVVDKWVFPEKWSAMKGVLQASNIEKTVEGFAGSVLVENITVFLPLFFQYLEQHELKLLQVQARKKNLDDLFTTLTGKRLSNESTVA